MKNNIIIKGAKENNLKNISIQLPRNKMIVITGISGSGKSSLAFDTIYAEGQRRYMESLSSYARQFLGRMEKPRVDFIEGLSPSISIDQKQKNKNPRSTVGTITEIYDYLRLLYSKIGHVFCHKCGKEIVKQTISQMVDKIMKLDKDSKILLIAPIVKGHRGEYNSLFNNLKKMGYIRFRIDNKIIEISENINLEKNKKHNIDVVIDRLIIKKGIERRLADSLEIALNLSKGYANIIVDNKTEILFSEKFVCISCGTSITEIEPRTFSFNTPYGSCPECTGLGFKQVFSEDLIIPNKKISINQGAIIVSGFNGKRKGYYYSILKGVAKYLKFSLDDVYESLTLKQKKELLYGTKEKINIKYQTINHVMNFNKHFEGIIPIIKKRYEESTSENTKKELEKYMKIEKCEKCKGLRLRKEALSVFINNKNISELSSFSIEKLICFFKGLDINKKEKKISEQIEKEILSRLNFLNNVGLNYLTLSRSSNTLSGGESQRIRLATQIGSGLVGVLYVLDEPSIGLHQKDNFKLIKALLKLRDMGNTVIVVEHDEETMKASDLLIDIGPKAGKHGGKIVAQGTALEVSRIKESLTGQYLSKKRMILIPKKRRKGINKNIKILEAQENNLKNINVEIPLGTITAITGVSGSGKSTLINEILYKGASNKIYKTKKIVGKHKNILGLENIDKIINIDQSPIGRTPRSNSATYTGIFDLIREIFSSTKESKARGYKAGRFSFNVKGGRCENCKGDGIIKIAMHFLPDVYVTCEVCQGKRYNRETLDIYYKNKTISEVLNMTVNEAYSFFYNLPKIKSKLEALTGVGLGYIKLGQSATTLSGGEAQRIKLAKELSKKNTGKTLYILDEPTTGLHSYDIEKLLKILNLLVEKSNTVVIIEHNLDVIKTADYIIDLGPEGGDKGGFLIAKGTPEEIIKYKKSYTSFYLKKILGDKY